MATLPSLISMRVATRPIMPRDNHGLAKPTPTGVGCWRARARVAFFDPRAISTRSRFLVPPAQVFFSPSGGHGPPFFGPRLVRFVPPPPPTDSQNAAASCCSVPFLLSPWYHFDQQAINVINKHCCTRRTRRIVSSRSTSSINKLCRLPQSTLRCVILSDDTSFSPTFPEPLSLLCLPPFHLS
jgi:hypothetical protein